MGGKKGIRRWEERRILSDGRNTKARNEQNWLTEHHTHLKTLEEAMGKNQA